MFPIFHDFPGEPATALGNEGWDSHSWGTVWFIGDRGVKAVGLASSCGWQAGARRTHLWSSGSPTIDKTKKRLRKEMNLGEGQGLNSQAEVTGSGTKQ